MRYSDELLEEIKSKNDICDVIQSYIKLTRAGSNYRGLCPFHNEKTPSFMASPGKQIFHCFGCGEGGNVFHFVSKIENVSFVEAVQILAKRAGITLPTNDSYSGEDDKRSKLREKVRQINELACEFYHNNLYTKNAVPGQEYVKKRHFDNATLKTFKIGFSGNFDELYKLLVEKGFKEEEILESGLVKKSPNGKFYDAYQGRLMFPIFDVRDRVIGFGGRTLLDEKEMKEKHIPKYVNSPENVVYSKSRNLFALNVAKKYSQKEILIVEGYMDVISLHQRGIHNVVASLGTAMTEAQGRLLRNTSEKVIIGYDADGAGQAAILRGLEILQNLGVDIRILQLDREAKDPDEYVNKYGPDLFKNCMSKAISLVEFKVKMLLKNLDINNVNDKVKFLNEIAKILSRIQNKIEQEVYVDKISSTYNISKDSIYTEIKRMAYLNQSESDKKADKQIKKIKEEIINSKSDNEEDNKTYHSIVDEKDLRREKLIIYLLVNYYDQSKEKLLENGIIDSIKVKANKDIISIIKENMSNGKNIEDVLNWFQDDYLISYLSEIMASDFGITNIDKCISEVTTEYERESLTKRRQEILKKLTSSITKEESASLEKELKEVMNKLAKIN